MHTDVPNSTTEVAEMDTLLLAPETDAEKARRLAGLGWGPSRILSGLGHPGYGRGFATLILDTVRTHEHVGLTVHDAIYGGVEALRKFEAAR